MKTLSRALLLTAATGFLFLGSIGCKSAEAGHEHDQSSAEGEHPEGDHPEGEHPKSDHPEGEHPKGEHPEGDHPKGA
jgi:hypothetical protein